MMQSHAYRLLRGFNRMVGGTVNFRKLFHRRSEMTLATWIWLAFSLSIPLQAISMHGLQLRSLAHWHGSADVQIGHTVSDLELQPDTVVETKNPIRSLDSDAPSDHGAHGALAHDHYQMGYHTHNSSWLSLVTQWLDVDAHQAVQHEALDTFYLLSATWALVHSGFCLPIKRQGARPSLLVASHVTEAVSGRLERPPRAAVLA